MIWPHTWCLFCQHQNTGNPPHPATPFSPNSCTKIQHQVAELRLNRQHRREGGTKWEREQEQRYRLSHNLYCPYLQPLPQEVSIWEESSAYNTVDGRLLPGHWALMLLCSPQPPSETTSVLPGLPISSITAHAWSRHGHASPCILPSDLIPVVLSPIPHHPPFLIQIFPYWVSYLPFPSSLSLYNLLSLGKFPRGYWQGF